MGVLGGYRDRHAQGVAYSHCSASVGMVAAACGVVAAQDARDGHYPATTGALSPATQLVPEWSGEAGSSGHPLMTAEAIRAAAANFHDCINRLWAAAARRGVSRSVFQTYTASLTPDLRIMDLLDNQPEFTKSFWDYLDILVTNERIEQGRVLLEKYRSVFDAVERAYGVDRYTIAAIWGVETNYGTLTGDRSVVRSTATLACIGRRQNYFREEFLSALEILQRGDVRPDRLVGSWAGLSGPPNSCRPHSKNMRWISIVMADAMSSIPCLMSSLPLPIILKKMAGS